MKIHPFSCVAFVSLAVFSLSSCMITTFAVHPRQATFNEAEFAQYAAPGSATVSGQLMAMIDGAMRPGDQVDVELLPVTSYTTEAVERQLGNGERLLPGNSGVKKYMRVVTSDSQGRFAFSGVPAGDYYVFGCVMWNPQTLFPEYNQYQWGLERIHVGTGQNVNVMVTHNPGHGFAVMAGGTIR